MSATTFAGGAQLAAVSVLASGGSVAAAVIAATLVNARYMAMGIAAADAFGGPPLRRLLDSQLLVDEAWAVAAMGAGRFDRQRLIGAGLLLYASWVSGTAIGLLGGHLLPDPASLGLDAGFPALFLALLAPQLRRRRIVMAALAAGLIALVLTPLTPAGLPIVAAAIFAVVLVRHA